MKRPPCEWRVKEIIPLIRAAIALIMIREYKLSIYQTSKVLGVTPAAISNYLSAKRSKLHFVNKIINDSSMHKELRKWVDLMLKGDVESGDVMCILCRKISKIDMNNLTIEFVSE